MKVSDILRLSAELRGMDCSKNAAALCERLLLDPTRKADELSFGNRKKVAIVCALQSDPPLLILDEPTSGLDPLMQHEFFDIIRERSRAGTTVFLSSHILSEVQHNCARAAVIREGEVIACGNVEELARTDARRIVITGSADLDGLAGVRDIRRSEENTSFLYSGEINEFLRRLAAGNIRDLRISEPDLEEIFMHYYEKEEDAQ
jgi:ABC-2 type transport system ATP-binding protein